MRPPSTLASAVMVALGFGLGCGFDWDGLDPRLGEPTSVGAGGNGGVGGTGGTSNQGGATSSTGGTGGTVSAGGAGGSPPQLTDEGLVVRYYLDEADAGQAPPQVLDDAAQPLNLDLTYTTNMSWTEVGGHRGLSFVAPELTGDGRTPLPGSKIETRLMGSSTATLEAVVDVTGVGTVQNSFINTITSTHEGSLSLRIETSGLTGLDWHGGVNIGRWPSVVGTGRVVLHAVLDTSAAVADDRAVLYVNGQLQTRVGGTPPGQGATVDFTGDTVFVLANGSSPDNSIQGVLHYFAMYDGALDALQVGTNAEVLLASDDGS